MTTENTTATTDETIPVETETTEKETETAVHEPAPAPADGDGKTDYEKRKEKLKNERKQSFKENEKKPKEPGGGSDDDDDDDGGFDKKKRAKRKGWYTAKTFDTFARGVGSLFFDLNPDTVGIKKDELEEIGEFWEETYRVYEKELPIAVLLLFSIGAMYGESFSRAFQEKKHKERVEKENERRAAVKEPVIIVQPVDKNENKYTPFEDAKVVEPEPVPVPVKPEPVRYCQNPNCKLGENGSINKLTSLQKQFCSKTCSMSVKNMKMGRDGSKTKMRMEQEKQKTEKKTEK
jgi:hypothetical protein